MPNEQVPATAAAAPVAPAPDAPIDMLVEVKVDGKVYKEPVSKLRESYQIQSAAQRRLEQANALKAQYTDAVAFHEGLNSHLQSGDFEGADARWRAFLEGQAGRPVRQAAKQNTSVEPTDGIEEVNPHTKRMSDELAAMRTELNTVRRNTSAERVNREVDRVLSTYPMYDSHHESYDEDARNQAELVLLAAAEKAPNRPLDEIAASTHTRHANMLARALTRTRDNREQATRQNPGVPPSQGTPGTAERQKWSRADVKNGRAAEALASVQKRSGSILRAMFPNG